jgi:hypothetical protein
VLALIDAGDVPIADSRFAAMDIGWAQELLDRPGRVNSLQVLLADPLHPAAVTAQIAALAPGLQVGPPRQRSEQVGKMIAAFQLNLTALSMVSLLVGVFLIHNTMWTSVARRRVQIGILRAIGLPAWRVRCIFLIRDPGPTIQSLLNLTQTFYEPWSVERAVEYYCTRLDTLSQYASRLVIGGGALALTYDDLVLDTPRTLRKLESFLGIASELREEYAIQPFTGKRGDPSEHIHTGRIAPNPSAQSIDIPDGALDRACRAYEACSRALRLTIRSSVP